MIEKEEIIRAQKLWFLPGDVFEIRILKAVTGGYLKPHTESGYFDYEHIQSVADAIGKVRAYAGAYVTINPVSSDLLARAYNCLCPAESESTTADSDIVRRRWLLIDCDAVRKAKISSTDAEHDAALAKAREIRDGLTSLGWPMPVLLDSGNGAQMTYRIDLPADDGGLVQRVITEIAKASSDAIKVDLTVYNPARIWRIPGTMNCKGDANGAKVGRPHRMAHILEVPDTITSVTEAQLRSVAGETSAPVMPPEAESGYAESDGFDADEWIAKFAPDAGQPVPYKDGRKWIFKVCPFNPAHDNSSAGIFQSADGKIGFHCHHDGCRGNDWKKFRVLREPGCYDRPQEDNLPAVDVTGILNQSEKETGSNALIIPRTEIAVADSIPFPPDLFDVPGFIGDVMKFSLKYAPFPNRPLAFAGAIALQAHLAARKVQTPTGLRTNPYIIALAKSGVGKDFPRSVNQRILESVGKEDEIIETVSSGQGLEDEMLVRPAALWQSDEFYSVLQEVVQDTTGQKQTLMKYLLTLFTSANKNVMTRVKAGCSKAKIPCPNLTLYATTTPSGFFDTLSPRFLNDGMYARLDIIIGESRCDGQTKILSDLPTGIVEKATAWANFKPRGSGNMDIAAMTVPYAPDAVTLVEQLRRDETAMYRKSEREDDIDWKLSVWSRACENALRYALVYSCSIADKPENAVITADVVRWAQRFMWWEIENKIYMTNRHYYKTEFERCSESVLEIMAKWHRSKGIGNPMPGWLFNRRTKHLSPKILSAVQQSLVMQERLSVESKANGIVYSLMPEKSK